VRLTTTEEFERFGKVFNESCETNAKILAEKKEPAQTKVEEKAEEKTEEKKEWCGMNYSKYFEISHRKNIYHLIDFIKLRILSPLFLSEAL